MSENKNKALNFRFAIIMLGWEIERTKLYVIPDTTTR